MATSELPTPPTEVPLSVTSRGCSRIFLLCTLWRVLEHCRYLRSKKEVVSFPFSDETLQNWLQLAKADCAAFNGKGSLGGTPFSDSDPKTYWSRPSNFSTWWKNNIERKSKFIALALDGSFSKDVDNSVESKESSCRKIFCRQAILLAMNIKNHFSRVRKRQLNGGSVVVYKDADQFALPLPSHLVPVKYDEKEFSVEVVPLQDFLVNVISKCKGQESNMLKMQSILSSMTGIFTESEIDQDLWSNLSSVSSANTSSSKKRYREPSTPAEYGERCGSLDSQEIGRKQNNNADRGILLKDRIKDFKEFTEQGNHLPSDCIVRQFCNLSALSSCDSVFGAEDLRKINSEDLQPFEPTHSSTITEMEFLKTEIGSRSKFLSVESEEGTTSSSTLSVYSENDMDKKGNVDDKENRYVYHLHRHSYHCNERNRINNEKVEPSIDKVFDENGKDDASVEESAYSTTDVCLIFTKYYFGDE